MSLSVAQLAEIREIFHQFDKNNDGVLAQDELVSLLKALDGDLSEEGIAAALKSFDSNANGVIEFQEFIDWFAEREREAAADDQ